MGTQIALTYILTIDDPYRFPKSREVGCFLGFDLDAETPERAQPQLHISKEGDRYLRTMLVQGAHYILGPFGERQRSAADGDGDLLRSAEGKMPRNERWLRWPESWRYCCIGCG